jgi:hypothetical protein
MTGVGPITIEAYFKMLWGKRVPKDHELIYLTMWIAPLMLYICKFKTVSMCSLGSSGAILSGGDLA